MKRDMELIRKMVLLMEDHPDGYAPAMKIDGYSAGQIGYHGYLLVDSGLATGVNKTGSMSSGPEYVLRHLTATGHDFAENARNPHIWDEAMNHMREKGLRSAALEVVNKLLVKQLNKLLDLD